MQTPVKILKWPNSSNCSRMRSHSSPHRHMPGWELIRLQQMVKIISSLTSKNFRVWFNSSDISTMIVQRSKVAQFCLKVLSKALIFQGTTISLLEHRWSWQTLRRWYSSTAPKTVNTVIRTTANLQLHIRNLGVKSIWVVIGKNHWLLSATLYKVAIKGREMLRR